VTALLLIRRKISHDPSALGGALFMGVFAALAGWRWYQTGSLFFVFLVFRDLLLSALFLFRKDAAAKGSKREAALAYASTILPLFYIAPVAKVPVWTALGSDIIFIVGFLIATLAAIELGQRMGVSPALRGQVCKSGVYRLFKHPMYAGYVIAESGWVLLNPVNAVIFGLSAAGYYLRTQAENKVLRT
jgi:protein-S-isoprenylcysteine O-methyltransferase Ste14